MGGIWKVRGVTTLMPTAQSNVFCFILGFVRYAAYYIALYYPKSQHPRNLLNLLRLAYMPSSDQEDTPYWLLKDLANDLDELKDDSTWRNWEQGERTEDPKWMLSGRWQLYPPQLLENLWRMFHKGDVYSWNPLLELWLGVHQDCFRVMRPHQFRSNRFFRLGSLLGVGLIEMGCEDMDQLKGHGVLPLNMQAFLHGTDGIRTGLRPELEDVCHGILAGGSRYQGLSESDRAFWQEYESPASVAMVMFRRVLNAIKAYREPAPDEESAADPTPEQSDVTGDPAITASAVEATEGARRGRPKGPPKKGYKRGEMAWRCDVSLSTVIRWEQKPDKAPTVLVSRKGHVKYSQELRESEDTHLADAWAEAYKSDNAARLEAKRKERAGRLGDYDPAEEG